MHDITILHLKVTLTENLHYPLKELEIAEMKMEFII